MNLHTYLTKHDGKPRPHGDELIRLSRAVSLSPYYVYMASLGHKRIAAETVKKMSAASIGGELSAVRDDS